MSHFQIGKRTLKTGIAVFITAQICAWLGWPSIFAVIAAIVTIEPSIDMSLKKGMIRLPAAGIGAAFAMIFDSLFGQQPLTYMLSALATIYVIQLLKWNDSLVIATLTAVNMISLTDAHFALNFLVRLGTTTTGIVVSALINFVIFPPCYIKKIQRDLPGLVQKIIQLSNHTMEYSLRLSDKHTAASLSEQLKELKQCLSNTMRLISWQLADYRYKRSDMTELRQLLKAKRTIEKVERIASYVEGMVQISPVPMTVEKRQQMELWRQWTNPNSIDFTIGFPSADEANVSGKHYSLMVSITSLMKLIHFHLQKLPVSYKNPDEVRANNEQGSNHHH